MKTTAFAAGDMFLTNTPTPASPSTTSRRPETQLRRLLSHIRPIFGEYYRDPGELDLSAVLPGRGATLARYAQAARAQALSRMAEPRRTATLFAVARQLEIDGAVDLLDRAQRVE